MRRSSAVAAIRVSTNKQRSDSDSPEAQKELIDNYAQSRGYVIHDYIMLAESASGITQPMQKVVEFCKKNKSIDVVIIKSIDRFTRGGSTPYDMLKKQLTEIGVSLVDAYGIISDTEINTLSHLEQEYSWSTYAPSRKAEILEAERSKDEVRDILSRVIGAEIRYTQMGYWMRQPPYGFVTKRVETKHGKRSILKPHKEEAKFVSMAYEMRAEGLLSDPLIVAKINEAGYHNRVKYLRSREDRTRIIGKTGGKPLTVKAMLKLIEKPINAGVNVEKWTNGKPVKCVFDGLVSIELFNAANRGKRQIRYDKEGDLVFEHNISKRYATPKGTHNDKFAYRKFVLCPECTYPFLGSSSRGKSGNHYPAYHCSNRGHYLRIPKDKMEERINKFLSQFCVEQAKIDQVMNYIEHEYERRMAAHEAEITVLESQIKAKHLEAQAIVDKLKILTNTTALKYMEEDLTKVELAIKELEERKAMKNEQKTVDIKQKLTKAKYFLEHLDELLSQQIDPIKRSQLFALFFNKLPTYEDLNSGTQKTPLFTGVNSVFQLVASKNARMVIPRRIELLFSG